MALTNPMNKGYALLMAINVPFLFGLAPGYTSAVIGGWSIGIEFAFYLMFPVVLAFVLSRYWWQTGLVIVAAQMAFIHIILHKSDHVPLEYTQPLAFIAYFYVGCMIGRLILQGRMTRRDTALPFLACVTLLLFGSGTSQIDTLLWGRGVALFSLSIAAVYFSATLDLSALGRRVSSFLGDVSYGVYLLHPIVFFALKRLTSQPTLLIPGTILGAVVLAKLSYQLYENPLRAWSKQGSVARMAVQTRA